MAPHHARLCPAGPLSDRRHKGERKRILFQVFHFEREGAGHRDCFYSSFSPSPFFPRPPLDLIPSSFSSSLAQPPPPKKKDVGDWTHALHELVREKGEARDGRLLLPSAAEPAAAAVKQTAASPTSFSVVAAASPRDAPAAPNRSDFGGSRDLESQLSAAAAAAGGSGLPPLPPGASSLALARGSSLSAPLPLLAATLGGDENHQHHPPLTKRVSFAEEKVAALVEEATKGEGGVGCDKQHKPAPSLPIPPPIPSAAAGATAADAAPRTNKGRSRRRTRDSDIPYTFSIDGPWGAPTQVRVSLFFLRSCFLFFRAPSFFSYSLFLFVLSVLSPRLFFPSPPSIQHLFQHRQEFADYDVIVLLGAGIGVTPMASVLRSLAHELSHARCAFCDRVNEALVSERIRQSKVYFNWILPDNEGVQWFSDVLYGIAGTDTLGMFDLNLHFTRVDGGEKSAAREANAATDTGTKSGVSIHNGRPDFDLILVSPFFFVLCAALGAGRLEVGKKQKKKKKKLTQKKKKKTLQPGPSQGRAPRRAHRRLLLRSRRAELRNQGDVPAPEQAHDGRWRPGERGRQRRGFGQSGGGERERVQRPLFEPQERLWRRRRGRDLVLRGGLLQERGRHHQGGGEEEEVARWAVGEEEEEEVLRLPLLLLLLTRLPLLPGPPQEGGPVLSRPLRGEEEKRGKQQQLVEERE